MDIQPLTLIGNTVRLEPLALSHAKELTVAAQNESIWRYMVYGMITTESQMRDWILDLLERQAAGTDLPFAVVHLRDNLVVGSTRYLEIRPEHRSLEIGGTWYATGYQRTAVNTECKYLLLRHAFEELDCIRVQFKSDLRNQRSQAALERIGAVKEGILRRHIITADGFIRDSVYYSIIDSEWPDVKRRLEEFLDKK